MANWFQMGKYASLVLGGAPVTRNQTAARWCGLVDVVSNANNFTVVSAAAVDATDLILLTPKVFGTETRAINGFAVYSVNPGVGFSIGTTTSFGAIVASYQVAYMIFKA